MNDAFRWMEIMVRWPAVAAVPLVVLLALYTASRQRTAVVVALLWAVYVVYEVGMRLRVFCSRQCGVREDLKIIYPVLALSTCVALVVGTRGVLVRRRSKRAAGEGGGEGEGEGWREGEGK